LAGELVDVSAQRLEALGLNALLLLRLVELTLLVIKLGLEICTRWRRRRAENDGGREQRPAESTAHAAL
jgi:hypothetical protein